MDCREFSVARKDRSSEIPCYQWLVSPSPCLTVIAVHGLGEHGRALPYLRLKDALVPCGHRVISYDQREHGSLVGRPLLRARLPGLVEDLCAVARRAKQDSPSTPVVAVGLSMGAVVAIHACAEHPGLFDGIVAASAPLGPVSAGPVVALAAKALGRVFPALPVHTGIDMSSVTDSRDDLDAYLADPLFRTKTRLGLGSDLLKAARQLATLACTLRRPALLLHGMRDAIAPWPPGLVAQLQGRQRVVRVFEQGHHNLFLDVGRALVFEAVVQWTADLCGRHAGR